MPGWHAKTKQLVADGKLSVAGIIPEQHPDRAKLYMQWQKMDWPVLADPYNFLGVAAVPITFLIDESGVIRYKNPSQKDLQTFLKNDYEKRPRPAQLATRATDIALLKFTAEKEPDNATNHFLLGVAYRKRYDSEQRQPGDFAAAVDSWQTALDLNPNQYIWRRRIQQYGPRLDKPYSFYDWIQQAREEITARGEVPHPLTCEPTGAEFAYPERANNKGQSKLTSHPDPEGRITLDSKAHIKAQAVVVNATKGGTPAARIHLSFKPQQAVTWTNDAGNISFHFDQTNQAFTVHDLQTPTLPKETSTNEERMIEFEIRAKKGQLLPKTINGAAFYYICTTDDGVCQYLRQNISIPLQ